MNVDPRYLRSRAKLHAAIFTLAAEHDPSTITVTSVAQQANVHRSTVYEHADSPEHLLRLAIESELGDLYETFDVANTELSVIIRETLLYLESREAIFSRMADETGVVIADAVSQHYMNKVLHHVETQGHDFFPDVQVNLEENEVHRILLRSVCGAIVRVQGEWLKQSTPRNPDDALELMRHVSPAWCPWNI